jgi:hypothetical protein
MVKQVVGSSSWEQLLQKAGAILFFHLGVIQDYKYCTPSRTTYKILRHWKLYSVEQTEATKSKDYAGQRLDWGFDNNG